MNNKPDIRQLLDKYVQNTCSPEEAAQLMHMLQSGDDKEYIEQLIEAHMRNTPDVLADNIDLTDVFEKLDVNDPIKRKRGKSLRIFITAAAAALLIAFVVATYIYFQQPEPVPVVTKQDVAPGGNRATLTLADGRTVDLSSQQSGIVVGDGIMYTDGSEVIDKGQLTIDSGSQGENYPLSIVHYQLSTPKGGTYQITLSDGTNVWLNSASKLKYPLQFDKKERVVELEGEAYFEVRSTKSEARSKESRTSNAAWPFRVVSNSQTVEVLGTYFNVNAYPDESTTNTTLLEGAVRVSTDNGSSLLKPGQQSKVGQGELSVIDVDPETVVDWKNGDFIFTDETLENIMRKVARWYNVNVIYEGQLPKDSYNAQISRNKNLSEVLHILELSGGVTYRITDGTLFLSPPK
ncbi:iron dicitrate transporter FecR [Parapedobacter defluvii]|uniref:Iron dicitrate transporter FecR n=1 Tax=Parapedobacter defluvii TaxID=2045106 RepID=A0ABQ1L7F2_9SPHI|nr:FecR family protein [Parapedobacter defluvii]GGC17701.1 iron dicitrate transporter FecR [Parapedobacter defluvii]